MSKVLVLIDLQNDYFPGGAFPLWSPEETLERIEVAIAAADAAQIPVVLVQHVADSAAGPSPFFNPNTRGVELHPRIRAAAPQAPVLTKKYADAFVDTDLARTLRDLDATELLIGGMMTHNCVTHTASSKSAEQYEVTVLTDCSTTVSELLHGIALHALSTRVRLLPWETALAPR